MTEVRSGILAVDDEEFWETPLRNRSAVRKQLFRDGFEGIVLDGPRRVPLDGRTTLPVAGCYVTSFADADAVPFSEHAVVVAGYARSGQVLAGRLFEPRVPDRALGRKAPPGSRGEGQSMRMFRCELADRLGELPWSEDDCYAALLLQDKASNLVRMQLRRPLRGYRDPEVLAYVAQRREAIAPTPPPPPSPPAGDPLPSYAQGPDSPPLPEAAGVTLSLPTQPVSRDDACVVHGAFRLPVHEDWVVPAGAEVGGPGVRAVVPLTLVLVGADYAGPSLASLRVPIQDGAVGPKGAELATGWFSLDLFHTPALKARIPQRYFVYALAGATLAGPHPVEVE